VAGRWSASKKERSACLHPGSKAASFSPLLAWAACWSAAVGGSSVTSRSKVDPMIHWCAPAWSAEGKSGTRLP
jgi:hypothetical protein